MDEMKINSKFLKNLIAKFVKREVKKKAGYEVDIQLNEFTATVTDGTAHVHLNVITISLYSFNALIIIVPS